MIDIMAKKKEKQLTRKIKDYDWGKKKRLEEEAKQKLEVTEENEPKIEVLSHDEEVAELAKHLSDIVKNRTVRKRCNGKPHPMPVKAATLALLDLRSDQEEDHKMTYRQISSLSGVPTMTVHDWERERTEGKQIDELELADLTERTERRLSNEFLLLSDTFARASTAPKKIERASLLQLTTASCQMADKYRLFRGESNQNIAVIVKRAEEMKNQSHKFDEEINKLQSQLDDM